MASQDMDAAQVATPEHAVRNLLADLSPTSRIIITHGSYRAEYHRRLAAIEAAFDRMGRS